MLDRWSWSSGWISRCFGQRLENFKSGGRRIILSTLYVDFTAGSSSGQKGGSSVDTRLILHAVQMLLLIDWPLYST
jgi:hypothetical protein